MKAIHSGLFIVTPITTLALICFAANSVLCRMALGAQTIDAAGFTIVRLASGAVTLALLLLLDRVINNTPANTAKGSWLAAAMLFAYAICFSFAYNSLSTGSGALILFGSVQISMILFHFMKGNRLRTSEWLGMGLAFFGFVYLILPGVSAPPVLGFILMLISGVAWAGYTLLGIKSNSPLTDTAWNFIRTTPLLLICALLYWQQLSSDREGFLLALSSGSIASGIGYALWYKSLPYLSTAVAAVVQLLVPVLAAIAGVVLMGETISQRLVWASLLILGGILLLVMKKVKPAT